MARRTRTIDDPVALRALAHPLRQKIWTHLAQHGPATSAMLAEEFGVDRGATSFHLRQLGLHGFIEVDERRSSGRRKFWRFVAQDLVFPALDGPVGDLGGSVSQLLWQTSLQALVDFHGRQDPWRQAAETSHSTMRLTETELAEFTARYHELLAEYARPADAAPDGARPVTALFAAFPNEPPAP